VNKKKKKNQGKAHLTRQKKSNSKRGGAEVSGQFEKKGDLTRRKTRWEAKRTGDLAGPRSVGREQPPQKNINIAKKHKKRGDRPSRGAQEQNDKKVPNRRGKDLKKRRL